MRMHLVSVIVASLSRVAPGKVRARSAIAVIGDIIRSPNSATFVTFAVVVRAEVVLVRSYVVPTAAAKAAEGKTGARSQGGAGTGIKTAAVGEPTGLSRNVGTPTVRGVGLLPTSMRIDGTRGRKGVVVSVKPVGKRTGGNTTSHPSLRSSTSQE